MPQPLLNCLRQLARFSPRRGLAIVLLGLAAGATEGFGMLLLIPLLTLLYPNAGTGESLLPQGFRDLPHTLGLPITLEGVLLFFLLLLGLQSAISYLRDRKSLQLRLDFVEGLRLDLHAAIVHMRWDAFASSRPSDFTHALISDINRVNQTVHALTQLLVSGLMACAYVAAALWISPYFTLLVVICALLLGLLIRPLNHRVHHQGQRFSEAHRSLMSGIQEQLASIKLTKCFGAEPRHIAQFHHHIDGLKSQNLEFQHNSGLTRILLRLGGGIALTLCVYLGVVMGELPMAQLLVLIYAFARLLPLISGLQQNYQHLLHNLPAFTATHAMLEQCQRHTEPPPPPSLSPQPMRQAIELQDVSYAYPGHPERHVLQHLSLTIPAQRTTAIIGPSGAGKSTLADLILGLSTPTQGHILLDGEPLDIHRWRASTAYVPQDTFLFHASIRANLQWAQPNCDDQALWQVLEMAAADGFVRRLPEGLDSIVGERGIQLSGGERQRIALARALLTKPSLLLLDEATSSLDQANENHISQAMGQLHGNLTILIIAHRPSTIREADHLVIIDQGRLSAQGSWHSLRQTHSDCLRRLGMMPMA